MDPTAVLSDADAAKGCCVAVLVVLAVAVVVSCGVSLLFRSRSFTVLSRSALDAQLGQQEESRHGWHGRT